MGFQSISKPLHGLSATCGTFDHIHVPITDVHLTDVLKGDGIKFVLHTESKRVLLLEMTLRK